MSEEAFQLLLDVAPPGALLAFGLMVFDQAWYEATGEAAQIPLSDRQRALIESIRIADGQRRATQQLRPPPGWLKRLMGE